MRSQNSASRSCPFSCTFCFHPTGRVYRERSLDDVFAELDHLIARYGVNMVAVLDELFAVKEDRLAEFCERIRPYGLKWMVQLHVKTASPEVLDRMAEAGCVYISYGLESFDDGVLGSMRKKATAETIERALRLTRERGIGIQGNFIFGDPAETPETAARTLEWWGRNRSYQINLTSLQLYPGTQIYEDAVNTGLLTRREALENPLTNISAMDAATRARLDARLMVHGETLLIPAPVTAFEAEAEDPRRGTLYRIAWTCPDCATENVYERTPVDNVEDFQALRLTCRGCMGRYDVENRARPYWHDDACEGDYAEAIRLRDSGHVEQAFARFAAIAERSFPGAGNNAPDAAIRAAFDAGVLALGPLKDPARAVGLLGRALLRRAFDPHYHLMYALALVSSGEANAAAMHLDQANRLVAHGGAADGVLALAARIGALIDVAGAQATARTVA